MVSFHVYWFSAPILRVLLSWAPTPDRGFHLTVVWFSPKGVDGEDEEEQQEKGKEEMEVEVEDEDEDEEEDEEGEEGEVRWF